MPQARRTKPWLAAALVIPAVVAVVAVRSLGLLHRETTRETAEGDWQGCMLPLPLGLPVVRHDSDGVGADGDPCVEAPAPDIEPDGRGTMVMRPYTSGLFNSRRSPIRSARMFRTAALAPAPTVESGFQSVGSRPRCAAST